MKKNKELINIEKALILNSRNPGRVLAYLRYDLESDFIREYILQKIQRRSVPGNSFVFSNLIVKNRRELGRINYIPFMKDGNYKLDFKWIVTILKLYEAELSHYLKIKNLYEKAFLKGDFNEALKYLGEINKITHSIWGIEQEMIIKELDLGLEEKTKFYAENVEDATSLTVAIALEVLNNKIDLSTGTLNYENRINSISDQFPENFLGERYKKFISFYDSRSINKMNSEDFRMILSISSTLSIIDLYEHFFKALTVIQLNYEDNSQLLSELSNFIKLDNRLFKLCFYYNFELIESKEDLNSKISQEVNAIVENYTIGNYNQVQKSVLNYEVEYGLEFNMLLLYIKSLILNNNPPNFNEFHNQKLIRKVAEPLYNILIVKDVEINLEELSNISKIFGDIDFKYHLWTFVYEFRKYKNIDLSKFSALFGEIYSPLYTPAGLGCFINKVNIEGKIQLYNEFGYSNSLNLILGKEKVHIPNLRKKYYELKYNMNVYELTSILDNLEELTNTFEERHYYYEKFALLLFNYLIDSDLNAALTLFIDSYLSCKDFVLRMEAKTFYQKAKLDLNIPKSDLRLVILSHYVDSNDTYQVYEHLISFIEENNCMLLSEFLSQEIIKSEYSYLLYICRYIYIKPVMKHIIYLNPKQTFVERIKILEFLIQNDVNNINIYRKEIKEINMVQEVQKRVKSLDETKIFVDVESILKERRTIDLERFKKYLLLESIEADFKSYDLKKELQKISIEFSEDVILEFRNNPEKKYKFILFKEIVEEFKDEVLMNSKYGLGKFLSSRIRHGLLGNTFTKSMKYHKILSDQLDGECFVLHPDREIELLEAENGNNVKSIEGIKNALHKFSKGYLRILTDLKDNIRIKDRTYPTGMFNYEAMEGDSLIYLYHDVKNINDYDNFYRVIIEFFWELTNNALDKIKNKLTDEVYLSSIKLLDELSEELEILKGNTSNPSVLSIISGILKDVSLSKTGIQNDINDICKWFVIKRNNEFYDFTFQELYNTTLQIIKNTNRDCDKIEFTGDIQFNDVIAGKVFDYWVDVFNMYYWNAIEHSGFNNYEEIIINTEIQEVDYRTIVNLLEEEDVKVNNMKYFGEYFGNPNGRFIKIGIKNNLASFKEATEINEIVSQKLDSLTDPKYTDNLILEEGGTGLTKIYYILIHNIKVDSYMEYSVTDSNEFLVNIYLEVSNLINKETKDNEYIAH